MNRSFETTLGHAAQPQPPRPIAPAPSAAAKPRLGVCSWSLQPASPEDLAIKTLRCGLSCVQLALDPLLEAHGRGPWAEIRTINTLNAAGVTPLSGMIGFRGEDYTSPESIRRTGGVALDEHWPRNLATARQAACLAARLRLSLITFHAGFIPHERGGARERILDRLRQLIDATDDAAGGAVRIGLETGQESAETLLDALEQLDRPHVGVNFDPANMILYGMGDPTAALRLLAPRVVQVHIKDALPAKTPGAWGDETPAGAGAVKWAGDLGFFATLRDERLPVDLLIEREAGEQRITDVVRAVHLARPHASVSFT